MKILKGFTACVCTRDAPYIAPPPPPNTIDYLNYILRTWTILVPNIRLYIKNNAWVPVNNDFWSRVRWFANDFHEWRSQEWKSLANHLTSDQKIVIHGNKCIILFLTRYFMSWTCHFSANNSRWLISTLSLRTAFADLTLWRHHSWSVTSHEHEALALWRHIRRLLLRPQICAEAIFTSE